MTHDTTIKRARALRRNMTDAEKALWMRLRNRQLDGLRFKRQEPIGPYFADFACPAARLVVEVDGGQHSGSVRDAVRDRRLQELGFAVLRVWNNDVLTNIEGVLETIAAAARRR